MVDGKDKVEIKNMEEALQHMEDEQFISAPKKGADVEVHILDIVRNELVVEIGAKSEGIIPSDELVHPIEHYNVGDKIKGEIIYSNEDEGVITISEKRRVYKETLELLREAEKNHTPLKGKVVGKNKGGYNVNILGVVEGFLPRGQAMFKRAEEPVGVEYDFEIIDLKFRRKGKPNIVVSRKKLNEESIEKALNSLEEGKITEGKVESIEKFGVFVDLGFISGLIPRSELTFDREAEPQDIVTVGQRVKVMVLKTEKSKGKITLSLKALQHDPWVNVESNYPAGKVVKGTVARILPFGFVVKLEAGLEGLVHSSEIFWTKRRVDIRSVVEEGKTVEVEVLSSDPEKRKLSLSLKRVKGNPWNDVAENYPEGKVCDAKVVKILPNGLIAELEEGISGFVHITELSWNFLDSIEEVYSIGDPVKVVILETNLEQQRIRLSIRKVEEDPWKSAVDKLNKGSQVSGDIVRMTNTGAIVMLDVFNIEAFLPVSQISVDRVEKPEDVLKIGDHVNAMVVRTVYEPEKERRNMVISIKQNVLETEKDDYKEYMNDSHSGVTLNEIVQQKEQE